MLHGCYSSVLSDEDEADYQERDKEELGYYEEQEEIKKRWEVIVQVRLGHRSGMSSQEVGKDTMFLWYLIEEQLRVFGEQKFFMNDSL